MILAIAVVAVSIKNVAVAIKFVRKGYHVLFWSFISGVSSC